MMDSPQDFADARRLYSEARDLMAQGKFSEAAVMFEKSSHLVVHAKTLELLGECRFRFGDLKAAIVPLAAATTLNNQVRAPSLLAEVLFQLGENYRGDLGLIIKIALSRDSKNRKVLAIVSALAAKENEAG